MIKTVTCIECPMGCQISVEVIDGKVENIEGNNCLRGKSYATDEMICPKRIVTSTVRADNGELIPVKTDNPVKKSEMMEVMSKINRSVCKTPICIGDVIVENIAEGINLVATGNSN